MATGKKAEVALSSSHVVEEEGRRHYNAIAAELISTYSPGDVVVIEVNSGAYVVASSYREAVQEFTKKFGEAPGWMCRIDADPYGVS